ncbi:MAG: hypothetical protein E7L00_09460 [Propionibacteriaceae bacterium]|nr:hypothetical protein [Propionibacteriaceae bacterium]
MGKRKTLWFRVPADADAPPLISETVGFTRLLSRPAQSHRMEVDVLDSHDARLLRAGIVVAHRRRNDEQAQWYIAAPSWPGIPDEASFNVSEVEELPESLRSKLSLFLRQQPIGPFAAMVCDRREYMLRGGDADLVAIRDDVITIARGGVTLSKTREITMTPQVKLQAQQREFIVSALEAVDASPMGVLPSLQQRIGPPATGLTSFRKPAGVHDDMNLEEFVCEIFLKHLHALVIAELEQRPDRERRILEELQLDLRGLALVLEPAWREMLEADVRSLRTTSSNERQPALLRVLDALVGAARAPKLGDLSVEQARVALSSRVEQALVILFDRCRALELDGPDEAWGAALRSATQLQATIRLLEMLFGKPARKLGKEIDGVLTLLRSSVLPPDDIELVGLSAHEAFQLGRDVEHARWSVEKARRELIDTWPEHVAGSRKALKKMRRKIG